MVKAKPLSHYFLWIAFILAACEGSRESAKTNALERYCIDSSLVILVKGINAISVDSVIVDLEVKNQCTDSVIRDYKVNCVNTILDFASILKDS